MTFEDMEDDQVSEDEELRLFMQSIDDRIDRLIKLYNKKNEAIISHNISESSESTGKETKDDLEEDKTKVEGESGGDSSTESKEQAQEVEPVSPMTPRRRREANKLKRDEEQWQKSKSK